MISWRRVNVLAVWPFLELKAMIFFRINQIIWCYPENSGADLENHESARRARTHDVAGVVL
jgi:hypothetical protein